MRTVVFLLHYIALLLHLNSSSASQLKGGDHGRIIGGSSAVAGQFPYMAAINVQTPNSRFFCSGALANFRWTITSGTCVYNATLFTVRLGSIYLNGSDAITLATSDYVLHPDFDSDTLVADVGLIKFHLPIAANDYINTLFTYGQPVNASMEAYAMGWGQTSDFDSGLSNRLQYLKVTVLPTEICKSYYGNQVTNEMFCVAGDYNEGICIGDNGGPLSLKLHGNHWILGVASFISANGCESVEPSGYTRILPFLFWIDSYIYSH